MRYTLGNPAACAAGIGCIAAGYVCHATAVDMVIANFIYSHFDGFPRNAFFLKAVMHEGMRTVGIAALALLSVALVIDGFFVKKVPFAVRRQLMIFLVSGLVFIGDVTALKSFTTPACPWDLKVFGGLRDATTYMDIFRLRVFGQGHCFPAGHSTIGYVWLGLAFIFADSRTAFVRLFLMVLPIGMVLGAAQIMRGAHFLSHELTTLGIACIIFSVLPPYLAKIIALDSGAKVNA